MHLFPFIDWGMSKTSRFCLQRSKQSFILEKKHTSAEASQLTIQLAIELKNLYIYAACIKTAVAKTYNDYHLKNAISSQFHEFKWLCFCCSCCCCLVSFNVRASFSSIAHSQYCLCHISMKQSLRVIGHILVWYFNCNFKTIKIVCCCHFYFILMRFQLINSLAAAHLYVQWS